MAWTWTARGVGRWAGGSGGRHGAFRHVEDNRRTKKAYKWAKFFSAGSAIRDGYYVLQGKGRKAITEFYGASNVAEAGTHRLKSSRKRALTFVGRMAGRAFLVTNIIGSAADYSCTVYGWNYRKKSGDRDAPLTRD